MSREPPRRDRLFFALFPDPPAQLALARSAAWLRTQLGCSGRVLPGSRLHLTVHFLGDHAGLSEALLEAASAAVGERLPGCARIRHEIAGVLGGAGRRAVVLFASPDPALLMLWSALAEGLGRQGLAHDRRPFRPHVTVLYDAVEAATLALPEPVTWTAHMLCLVHSRPGTSRYSILRRWPLPH